jgi:hypothetical protein
MNGDDTTDEALLAHVDHLVLNLDQFPDDAWDRLWRDLHADPELRDAADGSTY